MILHAVEELEKLHPGLENVIVPVGITIPEHSGIQRQSLPYAQCYDQGIWAVKNICAYEQGPSPWVWLGEKCKMIERPWVAGLDIQTWVDISASVWYLNSIQVNDYMDYKDL